MQQGGRGDFKLNMNSNKLNERQTEKSVRIWTRAAAEDEHDR